MNRRTLENFAENKADKIFINALTRLKKQRSSFGCKKCEEIEVSLAKKYKKSLAITVVLQGLKTRVHNRHFSYLCS